jgi:hypothetical protein
MRKKRIFFEQDLLDWITDTMSEQGTLTRTKLSQLICEKMGWKSSTGKLREADCRKEMLRLEREGLMTFPTPRRKSNKNIGGNYLLSDFPIPSASCSLLGLGTVDLYLIKKGSKEAKIWCYLIDKYHYLSEVRMYGQQIRYLIKSSNYGWIGAMSFNSPAWSVDCRDQYIGWSNAERQSRLQSLVCNNRFLILPTVRVKNLASFVLSIASKQLPFDWEKKYKVKPVLLETFVDKKLYRGTCYQAANWIKVGVSKGRGRNDIRNEHLKSLKDVYLYPLDRAWKEKLGGGTIISAPSSNFGDWVDEEMATLNLGDVRLNNRLKKVLRAFATAPGASVPKVTKGKQAETKAIYRLLDNEKVEMEKVLSTHYEATCHRIKEHQIILAPQDTTELDYTAHPATTSLGKISNSHIGLLLHDTLALTESGTPLGLIDIQVWKREQEPLGRYASRGNIPIEQKESYKWLKSYKHCEMVQKKCPETIIVNIGDREADIFELLAEKTLTNARTELLVRSVRTTYRSNMDGLIWDILPQQEEQSRITINVPRSGTRPARTATLSLKAKRLTVNRPRYKKYPLCSVDLTCIYVKEIDYDESVAEPLEWMLLSTMEVSADFPIERIVGWYTQRWCIETYHKTLKSGCKIEERRLGDSSRIERCLAIDLIVAWKIFYLTKLGREMPNLPCTAFFEECEWKALVCHITRENPPETPPTLKEATLMVGKLGGHLGRKGDGMPGIKAMWTGLQSLELITEMWIIMNKFLEKKKVRGGNSCGKK